MTELKNCIVCGNQVDELFDLGYMYPSMFIDKLEDTAKFKKEPFVVNRCDCGMVQLKYAYHYDTMFKDYWYRSSTNSQMVNALKDIVESIYVADQVDYAYDEDRALVWVDIGNNDGCLSRLAKAEYDCFMVGVDPALELNNKGNDVFINDYFDAEPVLNALEGSKADLVSAVACFYDLQNPHKFLQDVVKVMDEDGVFIVQLNDMWGKLTKNTFDDFVREHVAYYSLEVLDNLFKMNGLEIFDFEYNYTNGSSLRVYAGKTGRYRRKEHVDHEIESQRVFLDRNHLEFWFENTKHNMAILKDALQNFKAHGKKIGLIGASTKGNTTLMFSGLDNKVIDYALEVSPFKFDKYCLGSDIQILDEKLVMRTGKPDVLVAMVWHFKETFLKVFRDFINAGGVLVFPFPTPHMVTKDGTFDLETERGE